METVERTWNQTHYRLFETAIDIVFADRLALSGRTFDSLSEWERIRQRYTASLAFTTGATVEIAQAKTRILWRSLDAGIVPVLPSAGEIAAEIEGIVPSAVSHDAETLIDIETFLGVAPVAPISVDHPNMTPAFFDTAVKRAHDAGLVIRIAKDAETALISSASNASVSYVTTRTSCTCTGGQTVGRCLHRAYLIAHLDVFTTPARELVAA
jgi:hypothetical protein